MRGDAQAELQALSGSFAASSEKFWRELGGFKPTLYVNALGRSGPRVADYVLSEGHGLPEGPVLMLTDTEDVEEFRSARTPAERTQLETLARATREFGRLCERLAPLLVANGVQLLELDNRTNVAGRVLHWALGSPEPLAGIPRRPLDSCAFAIVSEAIDCLIATQPASRAECEPLAQVTGNADTPYLTEEDRSILIYLFEQHPVLKPLSDIEAGSGVSRRTGGGRVGRLVECEILHRPEGERQGVGLTSKGIELTQALLTAGR